MTISGNVKTHPPNSAKETHTKGDGVQNMIREPTTDVTAPLELDASPQKQVLAPSPSISIHESPSSEEPLSIDVAATAYPTVPSMDKSQESPGTSDMLRVLMPSYNPSISPVDPAFPAVESRQIKKGSTAKYCTRVPPTIIERRPNSDPILAGKLIWIMHEMFPDVPVAAGKAGVSWK
ncbi:hypothetical protein KC19_VG003200 [Ceratodon purpureus]|uniref:Uncharacterized protein n=1 Tax=Ceratodon purpureus TaxID=3225 RepID=A0A8T0HKL5_CERPU|nr:hypothetical protein KC19_VG003200 [Ceratodon purpureus]